MTNGRPGDSRPSKNARREAAREKAKQIREEQRKKERRNRFILQGSLILVTLGIVAAIAIVIYSTVKPPAPGPLNMLSDGIKIGQDFEAVQTRALQPNDEPVPSASNEPADVLDIRVYVDYLCPVCGAFEAANAEQIKKLVADGAATLEIHPIAILDRLSMGTKYSTRAANAAACVANYSPNSFFDFSALLFENQPEENTEGLTDDQLIGLALDAKVKSGPSIEKCITGQEFKSWVNEATDRALNNPIPNSNVTEFRGTPTVIVNGQQYNYTTDPTTHEFDPQEFASFLIQVLGTQFNEQATPSPSPSPTP